MTDVGIEATASLGFAHRIDNERWSMNEQARFRTAWGVNRGPHPFPIDHRSSTIVHSLDRADQARRSFRSFSVTIHEATM